MGGRHHRCAAGDHFAADRIQTEKRKSGQIGIRSALSLFCGVAELSAGLRSLLPDSGRLWRPQSDYSVWELLPKAVPALDSSATLRMDEALTTRSAGIFVRAEIKL